VAPPQRPGKVTFAAIIMILFGVLITLFSLLIVLGGAIFAGAGSEIETQVPGFPSGMAGAVAGVLIVFGVIALAIGILEIVVGANVLGGKGWARITGIVLAVILGLFSLSGLGSSDQGSMIVSIVLIAANVFVIWALISAGGWFAARAAR
jgi:hypothetical protein